MHTPWFSWSRRKAVVLVIAALGVSGCSSQGTLVRDAEIQGEHGNIEQAERLYREALSRDPGDAGAHLGLGEVLAERGDARGADAQFSHAERLQPGWSSRVANERRKHATRYLEQALSLIEENRPDDAKTRLSDAEILSPGLAEIAYVRGRLAESAGDAAAAAAEYGLARDRDPGDPRFDKALGAALVESGQVAYEAGRYEDARRDLAEAAGLDSSPEIRYLQGSVAFALAEKGAGGDTALLLDEAEAAFRDVVRARPSDRDASYNLGAVLLAARKFDDAAAWYLTLIRAEPHDPELYLALSLAHSQLGRMDEGQVEEAIGRALRADHPVEDPAGWARRSAARFAQSDLSRAFRNYGPPEEVRTYQRREGGLVEVWFYRDSGRIMAFRDGGRVGGEFSVPRP